MTHIFQSYSHNDGPAVDGDMDWPDVFSKKLKARIKQISPNIETEIFFDKRNRDVNSLPENIKINLDKSKILIPIFSPSYIQSTWCQLELKHFGSKPNFSKTQIFLVEKYPVGNNNIPEELFDSIRYIFHNEEKYALEYFISESRFHEVINQLAHDLVEYFEANSPPSNEKGLTVFLNPNLNSSATSISVGLINELKLKKINLVSLDQNNLETEIKKQKIKDQLSQASLSLHLIGNNNEQNDLLELEIARGLSKSNNLKVMIWISGELDSNSSVFKRLNEEDFITQNMELFFNSFEQFKLNVFEQINTLIDEK